MAPLLQKSLRRADRAAANRVSRRTVSVQAHHPARTGIANKLAPVALAALLSLGSGFAPLDVIHPAPVRADEEEVQEENLTPYERRQRELAKRRELLRQAREKALLKSSGVEEPSTTAEADAKVEAANAERRSAAEELKESLQQRATSYDKEAAKRPAPPPEPPALEAPKLPIFAPPTPKPAPPPEAVTPPPPPPPAPVPAPTPAPFFSAPVKVEAPPPPPAPKPAPAPAPAPKPTPVAAKKAEEQQPKKRRGPLPAFLAEFLVLGAMGGFFYCITTYGDQVGKAREAVGKALIELSDKVERSFNSAA